MNLQFFSFTLFFVCAFGVVAGDINDARKDALEKIGSLNVRINEVRGSTEDRNSRKVIRIQNIANVTVNQHLSLKNFEISDFNALYEVFKKRAEILDATTSVFDCLAYSVNNQEKNIKLHWSSYVDVIPKLEKKTVDEHKNLLNKWKSDMASKLSQYRKLYVDTNYSITKAKTESEVLSALTRFQQATEMLEVEIGKIDGVINTFQAKYLDTMQSHTMKLRSLFQEVTNKGVQELKKCFGKKL